jgi:excisionase family DNA binding protein
MTVADQGHYLNVSQAAQLLGVSRVTIWRWVRDGRLPVSRLGHRTVRISRADLDLARLVARDERAGAAASEVRASRPAWTQVSRDAHFVQFYDADAYLLDDVAGFIGAAIHAGDAGVIIATPDHREGIARRLAANDIDVASACAGSRLTLLDAETMLARFMVDGAPDPQRFQAVFGDLITQAAAGGRRVRIFGEMVVLLALAGNPAAAIRLEALWNELQQTHAFALFCAYPMQQLGSVGLEDLLDDVCAEHSHVIPAESYAALPTPVERAREVAALQQKARRLEAEIAERRRAEERLEAALEAERAARAEAEAALRLRDEFLSVAAHELKTPLTGLAGHTQLVLRQLQRNGQFDPARVTRALETIGGQADRLSRLLNQLLDVSRIEAGKLALQRQPTDLSALAREVIAAIQPASEQHTIVLDAPAVLMADVDPLRVEQLLTNVLDNAVRYSPDGGRIDVVLLHEPGEAAELSVRDRGIGIPLDMREQIFERYCQAHGNGSYSGLGLGLFICRQIVERHRGTIRAEFPPDGGTRFVVTLPVGVDEAAVAVAAADY